MATGLLIASIFPPICGGSAIVYHNLALHAAGEIVVLAARRHYQTGETVSGWEAFDRAQPYRIERMDLIRPLQVRSRSRWHSLWLLLRHDLPLKVMLLFRVAAIVRRERIGTVCLGELDSLGWLGPWVGMMGCRVVHYIHGEEVTTATPWRYFGRHRGRYLRRADAVVAVSRFTRNHLVEAMGVDPARITLIPNGIDTAAFTPGGKDPALVARYGLAGKRVLLSVGRLVERKGFDRTIAALPQILLRYPDVVYLIVGIGEQRSALERLAAEIGVADHVRFAGAVPSGELAAHYALADLFVLPNRTLPNGDTEGFGLVFLEANACGTPVIGGRAGGVVDAVQDGINGLLVDGDDTDAIAAAILRVLGDRALWERLRDGGLALADKAGWASRAKQFLDLCRSFRRSHVRTGVETA